MSNVINYLHARKSSQPDTNFHIRSGFEPVPKYTKPAKKKNLAWYLPKICIYNTRSRQSSQNLPVYTYLLSRLLISTHVIV